MEQDISKIRSAIISVYNKEGLDEIVRALDASGVTIYATGGSRKFIEDLGIRVVPVEEVTDYPSILGGRVKTLHPKIFGGILGRRSSRDDLIEIEKYEIPTFDLVVVDLYPFEETVASGATADEIIEKIDIGGVSLIRAAAKNYKDVLVIPSKESYHVINEAIGRGCESGYGMRRNQASKAFRITSLYDQAINKWFEGKPDKILRYGENPHQKGSYRGELEKVFEQLHGKELSYNNLLDIDAALKLIGDFKLPVTAILKHNNACGVSAGKTTLENWNRALESDPVSAFGGVIATNSVIDTGVAEEMNKLFFEVAIAPSFTDEALEILKTKKNRILLRHSGSDFPASQVRTILNGELWQDADTAVEGTGDLSAVTKATPDENQISDLLFANILVKHARSNAIVLARDGQLLASGVGQTSRVDALRQAIEKASAFDLSLDNAVMASDAFFPFPDCVEIADNAGITAVIQPGGSKRDQDSIDYCNEHGLSMVFTGTRHFRH